jgi:selenocysteine lyase/cysteine desulfurase
MGLFLDGFNFDPQVEDPEELKRLTRRSFFGLVGGAAAGLSLASVGPASLAEAEVTTNVPDLNKLPAAPTPNDEKAWETIASEFLLRRGLKYMNTGTRGPSPRFVHFSQVRALEGINTDYNGYSRNVANMEFTAALRRKLGAFVGAKENEVALTNNTSDGMIMGTWGPVLEPGDEIAYTNHDHVGGAHPILHRVRRDRLGVKVIDVSDPKFHPAASPNVYLKAFEAALTPRTKLLSFCHINYTDGGVLPVKQICEMARSKGIITIVDGAQPPGMMKLNLHDLGCDMYSGPFHKWMMSSMQTGFFYVREDMLDRIEAVLTIMPAGNSMYGTPPTEPFWKDFMNGAAKYELRGSSNTPARMAMDAALDYHNHLTPQAIEARDRYLAEKLRKGLRAIPGVDVYVSDDPRMSCALVSFTIKGVPTRDLNDMLWEQNDIYIRNVTHKEIDWDVNRASMHIMVTAAQVDTLLGAVEEIAKHARA